MGLYQTPRLRCDTHGNFLPYQCFGLDCFCVNRSGTKVGQSVRIGSEQFRNLRYGCKSDSKEEVYMKMLMKQLEELGLTPVNDGVWPRF